MSISNLGSFSFQEVPFSRISATEKWNLHPWKKTYHTSELKNSIQRVGVLHPPFLQRLKNGKFDIVTGNARITVSRENPGDTHIGCFIAPENIPAESLLDILLLEQTSSRQLSLAEKARFLEIALQYVSEEKIIDDYLPILALPRHHVSIAKTLQVMSLPEEILADIDQGILQEKMVLELLKIKKEDCLSLSRLFKELRLGSGKQKRIFFALRDLSRRHQTSITGFLKDSEITTILQHMDMNPPQKAHHLGLILDKKLAPHSTQAKNEFKDFTKSLELPGNFHLDHSPSFEKDTLTLTINFQDKPECARLIQKIKSVFS